MKNTFSNILGQESAVRILKNLLETKRLASSYLFWGPEGVGKKMAANAFAQALNCERGHEPCGICRSCKTIEEGNHGDVVVLEPGGPGQSHHIGTIREMQDLVNITSLYGGWKIVIMDRAEKMTEEGASALLKILEEPPPKTIFILISSRPENIFMTILSRCQAIRFLPLSRDIERKILEECLKRNSIKDTKVRDEILAISCGSIRKAMELLTPEREAWRKEIFNWNFLKDDIFMISDRIIESRTIKQDFIMDILHLIFTWFRDILFIKEGLGEILNSDYEQKLKEDAGRTSLATLWTNLEALVRSQRDIMYQVNSRLVLDTLFMTLAKESNLCTR